MNRFVWLMRREVWEHRAIWMAPAIVLAILLLATVTGYVFFGSVTIDAASDSADERALSDEDLAEIRESGALSEEALERLGELEAGEQLSLQEAIDLVPPEKRARIAAITYFVLTMLMFMVLGTIAFFYALDALYADRRDRSVLFWKSLPLSDLETVLAKFAVAALLIPLVAFVAAVAAQLLVATGLSVRLAIAGSPFAALWSESALGTGLAVGAGIAAGSILWYAPLVAYLLLASAWAPKSPFLWAVLPPVTGILLERVVFGTTHLAQFLNLRLFGLLKSVARDDSAGPAIVVEKDEFPASAAEAGAQLADALGGLLASPQLWLGLVAAAALLAGAVWVRRYRDETL